MVRIEINGKEVEAPQGSMVIEVADNNNIPIPRFCYHKKLSIAANCRMCLIEVEKVPKPLPACATPITDGMKIWTKSPKAIAAQKGVLEFLLINHPLDCPICDQGGECELQDVSMGYGSGFSRFSEDKITVKDKSLGSLISTDMTRCILCTRCVRFGEEVAGYRELGAVGRGPFTEITTFVEKNVDSEVSGNVIDLCPVGALTNKPFRFKARSWEMNSFPSIAPHDCIGSNINIHSRYGKALRVVPRENELVNEVWISDKDRFSIEAVNHESRLKSPIIKQGNKWVEISWEDALEVAVTKLQEVVEKHGAESIGALVSPNTTVEEQFLLQDLMRKFGSNNIDHRLRQIDFRCQDFNPTFPNLGIGLDEIENLDGALLISSNIHKEQPIAGLKFRKLAQKGGKVFVVNPVKFKFNFNVASEEILNPEATVKFLAGVAKAAFDKMQKGPEGAENLLAKVKPTKSEKEFAEKLLTLENRFILIGSLAASYENYASIVGIASLIAKLIHAKIGVLNNGANSSGAWLTGCVSHRGPGGKKLEKSGLNVRQMLSGTDKKIKSFLLVGNEPGFDDVYGDIGLKTIKSSDFVLSFSAFKTEQLAKTANLILPITTFAETSGTYINISGIWQKAVGAAKPLGESRPLWKILRVLGNLFDFEGFDYESTEDVMDEVISQVNEDHQMSSWSTWDSKMLDRSPALGSSDPNDHTKFSLVSTVPLYATDITVRHSEPLAKTNESLNQSFAYINPIMAEDLNINDNDKVKISNSSANISIPVKISEDITNHTILVPQGLKHTVKLGVLENFVTVEKA